MARNEQVTLTAGAAPALLSASGEDITSITICNAGSADIRIYPTEAETPPALSAFYLLLPPGGVIDNRALSDLAPGIAAVRVYGWTGEYGPRTAEVCVSHA